MEAIFEVNNVLNSKISCGARSVGLDLIRVTAILFVIAGHFFLNTNAANTVFSGVWLFPQGMLRTLFMTNVPLFLILTGYLNLNKTVNKKYYKGMIAVAISYVFISIITIIFRIHFLDEHISVVQWILKITDFSAINYAWYVEMWIGLFLLTPFLNILWKNIATRRHKLVLIGTLYLLSALPDMFNRYGVHLVPGYWEATYPLAFYFIGAYVREYQPKVRYSHLILMILGCCLINPLFNFVFVKNHSMIQIIGDGNGVVGIPLATMIFMLLYKIDLNNSLICKMLESISRVSLDMYLASYMFDIAVYAYFRPYINVNPERAIFWFFIIVPIVFIGSYIFAIIKRRLFHLAHIPTK